MDYEPAGYQVSDIVKMDILLNSEVVDAFATLVHRDKARARGQQMCKALADTIPPHMFKIPVQAAIGKEIIAREDIRPFRKDFMDCMKPGGRLCVITFHSLEDRIVKRTFKTLENPCICPPKAPICTCGRKPSVKVLGGGAVAPSGEETARNPRARSAKLRIAEKLDRRV